MIEIILIGSQQNLLRPRAGESHAFHQQYLDLVALPCQRTPIVGTSRQQKVNVAAIGQRLTLIFALRA